MRSLSRGHEFAHKVRNKKVSNDKIIWFSCLHTETTTAQKNAKSSRINPNYGTTGGNLIYSFTGPTSSHAELLHVQRYSLLAP